MSKVIKPTPIPPSGVPLTAEVLGQYVRAQRTRLGLRIDDAASLCGVAKGTLEKLERGEGGVKIATILQVFSALGLKLEVRLPEEGKTDDWY